MMTQSSRMRYSWICVVTRFKILSCLISKASKNQESIKSTSRFQARSENQKNQDLHFKQDPRIVTTKSRARFKNSNISRSNESKIHVQNPIQLNVDKPIKICSINNSIFKISSSKNQVRLQIPISYQARIKQDFRFFSSYQARIKQDKRC
jgi:hypothetical protein